MHEAEVTDCAQAYLTESMLIYDGSQMGAEQRRLPQKGLKRAAGDGCDLEGCPKRQDGSSAPRPEGCDCEEGERQGGGLTQQDLVMLLHVDATFEQSRSAEGGEKPRAGSNAQGERSAEPFPLEFCLTLARSCSADVLRCSADQRARQLVRRRRGRSLKEGGLNLFVDATTLSVSFVECRKSNVTCVIGRRLRSTAQWRRWNTACSTPSPARRSTPRRRPEPHPPCTPRGNVNGRRRCRLNERGAHRHSTWSAALLPGASVYSITPAPV